MSNQFDFDDELVPHLSETDLKDDDMIIVEDNDGTERVTTVLEQLQEEEDEGIQDEL